MLKKFLRTFGVVSLVSLILSTTSPLLAHGPWYHALSEYNDMVVKQAKVVEHKRLESRSKGYSHGSLRPGEAKWSNPKSKIIRQGQLVKPTGTGTIFVYDIVGEESLNYNILSGCECKCDWCGKTWSGVRVEWAFMKDKTKRYSGVYGDSLGTLIDISAREGDIVKMLEGSRGDIRLSGLPMALGTEDNKCQSKEVTRVVSVDKLLQFDEQLSTNLISNLPEPLHLLTGNPQGFEWPAAIFCLQSDNPASLDVWKQKFPGLLRKAIMRDRTLPDLGAYYSPEPSMESGE